MNDRIRARNAARRASVGADLPAYTGRLTLITINSRSAFARVPCDDAGRPMISLDAAIALVNAANPGNPIPTEGNPVIILGR
jgi:hypothetical protein